jgi:hypothetical protein
MFIRDTPPALSVQTALDKAIKNALGINTGGNVTVTSSQGLYSIHFLGAQLGGKHVDPLTAQPGLLTSTYTYASLTNVRVDRNSTNTTIDQLAADVQAALDKAAISAGITPGFLVSKPITSGAGGAFTADVVPYGAPNWVPQGPGGCVQALNGACTTAPINGGQLEGITNNAVNPAINNPVVGDVQVVAADPNNASVLWIGTVNGGIWKKSTNTITNQPHWTPLLDLGPSDGREW